MSRPVYILAVGARTPVGLVAESSAAAVRAGVSRVRAHSFFVDGAGEPLRCAFDGILEAEVVGRQRLAVLAHAAVGEAVAKGIAAGVMGAGSFPLFLALPEPRPGHTSLDAAWLAQTMARGQTSPPLRVELTGTGHAGAFLALEAAVRSIQDGRVEVAVAGGVDGYLEADTLDALEADRRLTREGVRGGFTPGEAAGAVVLASDAALQRAAAAPLAQVAGVATRIEQRSASDDAGLLGEALTEAVDAVCADLAGALVDAVYCDINGERWRAEEWGFASLRLGRLFRDASRYVSASGEWGDVGAATGALGCVLAVEAMRRGYARGPRALLWGASWSGLRGALLLTPAR